jgi:hypothetical protein
MTTLQLDDYQTGNLRHFLEWAKFANNGDWYAEVIYMLPEPATEFRPNAADEGYEERLDAAYYVTPEELEKLGPELKDAFGELHEIEREIAAALLDRPLRTWCDACHRLFRRLHAKATRAT